MLCKKCKYAEARLQCLICEQQRELKQEKYISYQFPETIRQKDMPFPQLNENERIIWILYLTHYTEDEIAQVLFVDQSTISRCLMVIRQKLL